MPIFEFESAKYQFMTICHSLWSISILIMTIKSRCNKARCYLLVFELGDSMNKEKYLIARPNKLVQ